MIFRASESYITTNYHYNARAVRLLYSHNDRLWNVVGSHSPAVHGLKRPKSDDVAKSAYEPERTLPPLYYGDQYSRSRRAAHLLAHSVFMFIA